MVNLTSMTTLTMYDQKRYSLDYENEDKQVWIFSSVKDLFEELNRIKETSVNIFINLPPSSQANELKIWRRIIRQAKANKFNVKIEDNLERGIMTRKIIEKEITTK